MDVYWDISWNVWMSETLALTSSQWSSLLTWNFSYHVDGEFEIIKFIVYPRILGFKKFKKPSYIFNLRFSVQYKCNIIILF